MAFCVCAMSLSTVSCGKLEDDINTLKGQVESLTLKLAELESKLNTEVTNLNAAIAAIEAKVAVIKVEDKDGTVVLTLANGNTLTVAKADGNVSNTGLVTTVTKDGKTYWAVVKNDGTVESLNVEVGHPDVNLSFNMQIEIYLDMMKMEKFLIVKMQKILKDLVVQLKSLNQNCMFAIHVSGITIYCQRLMWQAHH